MKIDSAFEPSVKKRVVVEVCLVLFILLAALLYNFYASTSQPLTAFVVLNESAANSAPLWTGKKTSFAIAPDSSLVLNLKNYFTDKEGDELIYLAASTTPFDILVDSELVKITPPPAFTGPTVVTLIASDMASTIRQEIIITVEEGLSPAEQLILNAQVLVDKELAQQFEIGDVAEAIILFDANASINNLSSNVKDRFAKLRQELVERDEVDFGYNLANPNSYDLEIEKEYALINAVAVKLTKRGFSRLIEDPAIDSILSDKLFHISSLSQNLGLINIDPVREENLTGSPVGVCILDTGIAPDAGFKVLGGYNFIAANTDTADDNNHGTHVSGIISSISPGSWLVPVKVCNHLGSCSASNIISGIDYCLENKDQFNISVISGSFGDGKSYSEETCPALFDPALALAKEHHIFSVFASGNEGYRDGVSYPACSPFAIGVGAVNNSDSIAGFSNLGSALDLLAPGVGINSTIITGYAEMSGTSMAAPHVSGVIALLASLQKSIENNNSPDFLISANHIHLTRELLVETGVRIENYSRIDAYHALLKLLNNFTINEEKGIVQNENAKIEFYKPVDLGAIRKCSRFAANYVEIFSSQCQQYNIPARITMWNINFTNFTILRDNKPCPSDACSDIIYENNTLSFDVSNFSSYQVIGSDILFSIAGTLGCGNISAPGVYTINEDAPASNSINVGASGRDCYIVTANNVWFDCLGGTLYFSTDSGFTPGIAFNVQNISNFTLIRCNIRNLEKAVYFYNVSNSSVSFFNVTEDALANYIFNNTLAGIVLNISSNNSVAENYIYNNSRIGIHLFNSSNNTILNNRVYNHTIGIWLNNSHNNSLLDHEDGRFNGHNNISVLLIDSFDNLLGSTIASCSNFTTPVIFQNSTHGGINYSSGLNLAKGVKYFISNYMQIKENFTRVDSVNAPMLNRSATLTFRNLNLSNPYLIYDPEDDGSYIPCPTTVDVGSICTELAISNSTVIYNVTHFTTFGATSNISVVTVSLPPSGGGSKLRPPVILRKTIKTAPPPPSPPPPVPPQPPKPQLQTPAVIGQALSQEVLKNTRISCGYVLDTLENQALSFSETFLSEELKKSIPRGYEAISAPLKLSCAGEDLDLSFNLPGDYEEIKALRCNKAGCTDIAKEISRSDLVCGGKTIQEIRAAELSRRNNSLWLPEESNLTLEFGKLLTNRDRVISFEGFEFEALANIENKLAVRLETPRFSVPQPLNPSVSIIGSPLQLSVDGGIKSPFKVRLTLPFVVPPEFDQDSLAVYWLNPASREWKQLKGVKTGLTISVLMDNLADYLVSNKAIFAVQGLKCINCFSSSFEKVYDPGVRDGVVLVHGFTSSPLTWQFVIDDFVLNKQPFQIWTFGYPSTLTLETIANDLAKQLEMNSNAYDRLYLVGHSLGGLVIQEALSQVYKNKAHYSFLDKVRDVVVAGAPNEGSPAAEVYYNLFNHFLNKGSIITLFNVDSVLVRQLSRGKLIPRVPFLSYQVVAGTAPYIFNLGLFTFSTEKAFGLIEPNDGIVTVRSAQHIGEDYVNNSCLNFFAINLTHTELLDNPVSRRVIEKQITKAMFEQKPAAPLVGFNKYARLLVANCAPDDTIIFVGKKIRQGAMFDSLGCSCGNNICGVGEDVETCPQDCAVLSRIRNFVQGPVLVAVYTIFVLFFIFAVVLLSRKLYHLYEKKSVRHIKRELAKIKERLE